MTISFEISTFRPEAQIQNLQVSMKLLVRGEGQIASQVGKGKGKEKKEEVPDLAAITE
jgi:hypothetical protein